MSNLWTFSGKIVYGFLQVSYFRKEATSWFFTQVWHTPQINPLNASIALI